MFEGFQRKPAKGPLRDFREKRIANLLKPVCCNAGNAVGNRQPDGAKREFRNTASRQIINRPCLKDRGKDGDEFGRHKRQQRKHDPRPKIEIANRPEERRDPFRRLPASLDFAPFGHGRGFEGS